MLQFGSQIPNSGLNNFETWCIPLFAGDYFRYRKQIYFVTSSVLAIKYLKFEKINPAVAWTELFLKS